MDSPLLEKLEHDDREWLLWQWRRRRASLREELGSQGNLRFEIEKLLYEIDPMGISDPVDEYSPEARAIQNRLGPGDSVYDIKRIVESEFKNFFNDYEPDDVSSYKRIASGIAEKVGIGIGALLCLDINFCIKSIVDLGPKTDDGRLVEGVKLPWHEIIRHLSRDPDFLYQVEWRELEEIIAGAYKRSGCPEVILTPRSGDDGRDVIASWPGYGAIRIVDQVKAYSNTRVVTADEVRSIVGVLTLDRNVSKGIISTTADFAPSVRSNPKFCSLMPYRLELRSRNDLVTWLTQIE